jgi:hypothetical protein
LAACNIYEDRLRQPANPSPSPLPFSTATPGGFVSVWMSPPTELANLPTPNIPLVSQGEVVSSVATATAAVAQIQAATQTAQAPTPQPAFQTELCPEPRTLPLPLPPATFSEFPATIGVYLSNGGAPAVLESALRTWGAITDKGGLVQADTDLTGDKLPEIVVLVFNPSLYNPRAILNSGQLLIYGCDNRAYRLLYSTPNDPRLALPVLYRVGDMNGDAKAEVFFDWQSCTAEYCLRQGTLITWNNALGAFTALNDQSLQAINGRLGVADVDNDGILEITLLSNPFATASTGPLRAIREVWDWTGQVYTLAIRREDEPRYRIHRLHEADNRFLEGNLQGALRNYLETRNNPNLIAWGLPDETELLRAYAGYRLVTLYARQNDFAAAEALLATMNSEIVAETPAEIYRQMATAFLEVWRVTPDLPSACNPVFALLSARPDALNFLNSFGSANRQYSQAEFCPT